MLPVTAGVTAGDPLPDRYSAAMPTEPASGPRPEQPASAATPGPAESRASTLRERGDSASATTDFFGTSTVASDDPSTPAQRAYLEQGQAAAEVAELAQFYRYLADAEFAGYCDLYAAIARGVADDTALLTRIATLAPAAKIIPVLLFAAVHDQLLREPMHPLARVYRGEADDGDDGTTDPTQLFKELVLDRFDALQTVVQSRTIQTNEVGRSAVLLPALTAVHRRVGRPLALIEIGPSAGLNLFFDRYGYEYTRDDGGEIATGAAPTRRAGSPSSPVQLTCSMRSDLVPPLDDAPPPVASRVGIDLNPIDVRNEDDCRWLEACIWPLVPLRAERFRAAAALAREDPPDLRQGSALDLLPDVLAAVPHDVLPVVLSTWVLAYFSKDQRAEVGALLDDVGRTRDLAAVSAEYPSVAPWVPRPERPAIDDAAQGATTMGWLLWQGGQRDARALAWTQAHGRWLDWLDADTASS
jgi:hypothetical protein